MESLEKDSARVHSQFPYPSKSDTCFTLPLSPGLTCLVQAGNAVLADRAVLLSLQMTEGRHCQVHLLDDRNLELLVQVLTSLSGHWQPGPGCSASFLLGAEVRVEDKLFLKNSEWNRFAEAMCFS